MLCQAEKRENNQKLPSTSVKNDCAKTGIKRNSFLQVFKTKKVFNLKAFCFFKGIGMLPL